MPRVGAEFHRMFAAQIREGESRIVSIFKADDRQRARLADAGITRRAEDRKTIGVRSLIGAFNAKLFAKLRAGRRAFLEEDEIETVEAKLGFHDERWRPGADPVDHAVEGLERGIAGEGVLVAEAELAIQARDRGVKESGRACGNSVLLRVARKEVILLVQIPVDAAVNLVPPLPLFRRGGLVIDDPGACRQRIRLHHASHHRVEAIRRNRAPRKRIASEAAGRAWSGAERGRIEDVADGVEIAAANFCRGNGVDEGPLLRAAIPFVVGKEEQLVFDNLAAKASAKLILAQRRLVRQEEVASVGSVVAQEVIRAAVPFVRARF